jgi:VanZ family protein
MSFRLASARHLLRTAWGLAVVVVIIGSLLPSNSLAIRTLDRLLVGDKVEHTVMYAVLAFLPVLYERFRVIIATAAGAIALGVGLEFAQLFSGWRNFEIGDMIADGAGVCLGLVLGVAIRSRLLVREVEL